MLLLLLLLLRRLIWAGIHGDLCYRAEIVLRALDRGGRGCDGHLHRRSRSRYRFQRRQRNGLRNIRHRYGGDLLLVDRRNDRWLPEVILDRATSLVAGRLLMSPPPSSGAIATGLEIVVGLVAFVKMNRDTGFGEVVTVGDGVEATLLFDTWMMVTFAGSSSLDAIFLPVRTMATPEEKETDELTLDQEYRQCLQVVRDLIPSLEEPNDIHKTAQWIERFNRTRPDEKVLRNRCAMLLQQQLAEDNLTHPFIFQRFLVEPLEKLLPPDDPDPVGDGPLLVPLQELAEQAETLNRRTEGDISELQQLSKPTQTNEEGSYLLHLQKALRSALLLQVPDILEHPESPIPALPDTLRATDREWLSIVLEGIRAKAYERRRVEQPQRPSRRSIESQTADRAATLNATLDRDEIERYLERKFAKLYASFRVREKAFEIRTQSAGGIHLIDVSQRLIKQYRQGAGQLLRTKRQPPPVVQTTLDRNRRRSDN
uniref:DUF4485 domain-containing protein n=1 Tax=Anopheles atroparvus TaxID=41427 RepID=A0A182J2M1_ANOAO